MDSVTSDVKGYEIGTSLRVTSEPMRKRSRPAVTERAGGSLNSFGYDLVISLWRHRIS